ncbi:hypothetical protein ABZP36_034079 [Zizania latifolia]
MVVNEEELGLELIAEDWAGSALGLFGLKVAAKLEEGASNHMSVEGVTVLGRTGAEQHLDGAIGERHLRGPPGIGQRRGCLGSPCAVAVALAAPRPPRQRARALGGEAPAVYGEGFGRWQWWRGRGGRG